MATVTLTLTIFADGALTDPTTVELEDTTDTFGSRRTSVLSVITASGTALTKSSTGVYTITFDPTPQTEYEYEYEVVYNGTQYNRNYVSSLTTVSNTLILPSTTYYSSQAEVYRTVGSIAADLLEDDLSNADRHIVWANLLDSVTSTFNLYLHQFYTQANLLTNSWVRRRATVLAAHLLTSRRGNPPHFTDEVERVYNELDLIRAGRLTIPSIPEIGYMGPAVRNYEIESWRMRHPLRVEESTSMGESYSGQDIAWEYPFWY